MLGGADYLVWMVLEKISARFILSEVLSPSASTGRECTLICLPLPKKCDGKLEELCANSCPCGGTTIRDHLHLECLNSGGLFCGWRFPAGIPRSLF